MYEREVLDMFQCVVLDSIQGQATTIFVSPEYGFAVDFNPTAVQLATLQAYFKPLNVRTLFSVEERKNSDPVQLIRKQVLDYLATYNLGMPGIFNLEVTAGKVITFNFIKGITQDEVNEKIQKLLYANAPVKDAIVIRNLMNYFRTPFDINKVANNELRVALFNPFEDKFANGDDAVRYLCYAATTQTLLIKSKEVIAAVKNARQSLPWLSQFLVVHKDVLAQVFNRHKPLILALKTGSTKSVINEIGRLSKSLHVPVHESFAKNFVSAALKGSFDPAFLDKTTLRDRFKFLNILEYKFLRNADEVYVIRNGKTHLEPNRPVYDKTRVVQVQDEVLKSIKRTLEGTLAGKSILLDKNVDYGLPISRKQALGRLPFGTRVSVDGAEIASGIYWENEWGATDLDLSAIDYDGNRTGWGQYSGYSRENPIVFSGDITYAPNGAMEFMTSHTTYNEDYGLLVNSYAGGATAGMELVVGSKSANHWITDPVVREKHQLPGRGAILGFVKNGKFIVYSPAVGANAISSPKNAKIIQRGMADFWTVRDVLDVARITYDLNRVEGKNYDFDLTYSNFSLDKLEELF